MPFREHTDLPEDADRAAGRLQAVAGRPLAGHRQEDAGRALRRHEEARRLARALALEPEILFLDEPTSGLDPIGARAFDSLVRALSDSLGLTVFMVTHDLDTLLSIIDRTIALSKGKVIADGPVAEVRRGDHPWIREYFSARAPHERRRPLMEPEAKYTLVGGSVLVLLAMLVGAVAWLASASRGTDAHRYKIYFTRQSLEGLQVRSDVRMRGIRVGAVTGFSFAEDRPGTVEVGDRDRPGDSGQGQHAGSRRSQPDHRPGDDPVAEPDRRQPADRASGTRPGRPGHRRGRLATAAVLRDGQRAGASSRRDDAPDQRDLSNENQVVLAETLVNLRDLSQKAEGAVTRADAALLSVARTADAVGVATTGLSRDVHRLADRFDTLGVEAGTTLRDASAAMRQISGDVNQLSRHAESLLVDSNAEVRLTAQQLRGTADAVGTAARKFRDPRATLFGPGEASLGPGESR